MPGQFLVKINRSRISMKDSPPRPNAAGDRPRSRARRSNDFAEAWRTRTLSQGQIASGLDARFEQARAVEAH